MCGIAGAWGSSRTGLTDVARNMAAAIRHRGPDDEGIWLDEPAGLALVQRRLSIIDLSSAGHQPMLSSSGRYVFVFNGEIYNHAALRAELEARENGPIAWRGSSDSETFLALIEADGPEAALRATVGMFALALWDRKTHRLLLARDRMGEKPLYYGWQGKTFLFGSELAALAAHPAFEAQLNVDVVPAYLELAYIPSPHSIWRGIHKLPPGTLIEIAADGSTTDTRQYWSLADTMALGAAEPFQGSTDEAIVALDSCLQVAVAGQLEADVPLGAFLSGGIDSSLIVALMQARMSRPVKSFAIGFHEKRFDEAKHASAVAAHLGTEHTEFYLSTSDARSLIPEFPGWFGEPFGDASALPTYLVSRLTRQSVTVALSGDGGDELFGGYPQYLKGAAQWNATRRIPQGLRTLLGKTLSQAGRVPPDRAGRWAQHLGRAEALGAMLSARDSTTFYRSRRAVWRRNAGILSNDALHWIHPFEAADSRICNLPVPGSFMALDAQSYLPDDILAKVDRTAMAVSLETRTPFLDHRVVSMAASLPLELKLRDGTNKWVLRQLLYRYVPQDLVDRPKAGFSVPLNDWLRGPLRDWAEALLTPAVLQADGLFNPKAVGQYWNAFQTSHVDLGGQFWVLLAFLAWREDISGSKSRTAAQIKETAA